MLSEPVNVVCPPVALNWYSSKIASAAVVPPPLAVEAIVTLSPEAFVVRVTLLPATRVRVSLP